MTATRMLEPTPTRTTAVRRAHLGARVLQLLVGVGLYGVATALMVRAVVGVSSWTVLTEGLERLLPWSFGTITLLSSFVILLAWIPLRQRPGIGTLLNTLIIGPAADATLAVVPTPAGLGARILLFVAGLLLLGVATACYIGAGLGTGARDGLMVGLHERFGWPIWAARTAIELSVVAGGWLLGGDVGVGTVVAAFAVGPIVGRLMPLFVRFPWSPPARAGDRETRDRETGSRPAGSDGAGTRAP
ncbi:membrane protein YczE [Frondihabitans cladoniiphilus]|uniref:membrane protein YczE n=1 Tax=Frondihabitans cladoniiphilus TaxID=715785 RepID=UPI0031EC10D6